MSQLSTQRQPSTTYIGDDLARVVAALVQNAALLASQQLRTHNRNTKQGSEQNNKVEVKDKGELALQVVPSQQGSTVAQDWAPQSHSSLPWRTPSPHRCTVVFQRCCAGLACGGQQSTPRQLRRPVGAVSGSHARTCSRQYEMGPLP